jgi:multiple sugar transport system substrate-binding protein
MKRLVTYGVVLSLVVGVMVSFGLQTGLAAEKKLVIAGRDGVYGDALQLAVDAYRAKNPGVEIELLKLPYAGLQEKVVIDLKEATGAYDLLTADDTWIPGFAAAKWLTNLTELYASQKLTIDPDFVGAAVDAGRYPYEPGKAPVYGLPFVGNVELFAYRKDLFAKYGLAAPPKTWDEVLAAAKLIGAKEPGVAGVVFRGVKGNPITSGFLPVFWAFGAEIVDAQGKPTVNSAEGVAALTYFLELAKSAPKGVEVYNASEVRDALLAGKAAIAPEVWPAWVPDLDNAEKSKVVGQVEVTVHPGQKTSAAPLIGIWHLAIPQASKRKDVALDFLQFVSSKDMQKRLALEVGLPPTRASVYTDPEVVAKYRWYPAQLKALEAARVRPRLAQWPEMEGKIGAYLNLALIGDKTPEQAMKELQAELVDILGQ